MFQLQTHADPASRATTPRPAVAERLAILDGIARELMPPVWALGVQCSVVRLPTDLTARERGFVDAVELNVRRIARVLAGVHDLVLAESQRAASPGEQSGIDLEFGAGFGVGPERGVKAAVARRVILGHAGTLARFATSRAVAYVALLPRRSPEGMD